MVRSNALEANSRQVTINLLHRASVRYSVQCRNYGKWCFVTFKKIFAMNMSTMMLHYSDICHSIDKLVRGPENLLPTLHAADGMTNVVDERWKVVTNLVDVHLDHKCKCREYNCKLKNIFR